MLASNYNGQGSADLEALFLFLRAGVMLSSQRSKLIASCNWAPSALDAFVANTHFYANSDAHGKTLSEVITWIALNYNTATYRSKTSCCWDQSYGNSWHMRSAMVFTILFGGQWNDEFMALAKTDTELARLLGEFTAQT